MVREVCTDAIKHRLIFQIQCFDRRMQALQILNTLCTLPLEKMNTFLLTCLYLSFTICTNIPYFLKPRRPPRSAATTSPHNANKTRVTPSPSFIFTLFSVFSLKFPTVSRVCNQIADTVSRKLQHNFFFLYVFRERFVIITHCVGK